MTWCEHSAASCFVSRDLLYIHTRCLSVFKRKCFMGGLMARTSYCTKKDLWVYCHETILLSYRGLWCALKSPFTFTTSKTWSCSRLFSTLRPTPQVRPELDIGTISQYCTFRSHKLNSALRIHLQCLILLLKLTVMVQSSCLIWSHSRRYPWFTHGLLTSCLFGHRSGSEFVVICPPSNHIPIQVKPIRCSFLYSFRSLCSFY